MHRKTLESRIRKLQSWNDCCNLAADLYGADAGLAGHYLQGWRNAADMISEECTLSADDWAQVRLAVLADVSNYFPSLVSL